MIDAKVALLSLALVGTSGALGFGALRAHGGLRGHRNHAMMEKFIDFTVNQKLDEIQASDAQKQKVGEVKDRLLREAKALHEDREPLREQLTALLAQDEPDAAKLRSLVRERTVAFTRFADDITEAVLELHGVFSPGQRKQLMAGLREHLDAHQH